MLVDAEVDGKFVFPSRGGPGLSPSSLIAGEARMALERLFGLNDPSLIPCKAGQGLQLEVSKHAAPDPPSTMPVSPATPEPK